ncbi:hypothetical protein NUACC21_12050 [Scytonema sp. NUACC21]
MIELMQFIYSQIYNFAKNHPSDFMTCLSLMILFIFLSYLNDFNHAQDQKYLDSLGEKRYIKGYRRKDGTFVRGYYRRKSK